MTQPHGNTSRTTHSRAYARCVLFETAKVRFLMLALWATLSLMILMTVSNSAISCMLASAGIWAVP